MPFTKENAKEYSRKGIEKMRQMHAEGKVNMHSPDCVAKAIETKRQKKKMKDELKTLLTISLNRGDVIDADDILNLDQAQKANISVQTAINIAMMKRAIMGDVSAATWVRDTVGEKPTDKIEVDTNLTVEEWAKNHKVKL